MFRKSSLDLFLNYDTPENWKICPDKFLLNFAHLLGGSAVVYAPLVGYRRHGQNAGCSNKVFGDKKFQNAKTTQNNIKNNLKIRKDMLNFILKNKKAFTEAIGARGLNSILWQISLSYFKIDIKKVFSCIFRV